VPDGAQRELFGPKRRRVPEMMDLKSPVLLGPVQNQEHHMNGVVARRTISTSQSWSFLEQAYAEFGTLTGRHYGFLSRYKCEDAENGVRVAGLRGRQHRSGLRLPAGAAEREGCSIHVT